MNDKPTSVIYKSEIDGVWVVHIDTYGEDENGPLIRIYLNDGDVLFENPQRPKKDK